MRYERKYKVDHLTLSAVHQILKLHPASLRKIYPDRQVNNVYFDTPGLITYKENVLGISERKKYRVRWYGKDTKEIKDPKFEIKAKVNQLGDKFIFPVHAFGLSNLKPLEKEVNAHIKYPSVLSPSLLNAYHRSYYGTSNGQFRITVDSHTQFFSLLGKPQFTWFNTIDRQIIIELKYEEEVDDKADFIMQYLPFRQTKSSKYVAGIDMTMAY